MDPGHRVVGIEVVGKPGPSRQAELRLGAGARFELVVIDSAESITLIAVRNDNAGDNEVARRFHVIHAAIARTSVDVYQTSANEPLEGADPSKSGLPFRGVWYGPESQTARHIRVTLPGGSQAIGEAFLDQGTTLILVGSPNFLLAMP